MDTHQAQPDSCMSAWISYHPLVQVLEGASGLLYVGSTSNVKELVSTAAAGNQGQAQWLCVHSASQVDRCSGRLTLRYGRGAAMAAQPTHACSRCREGRGLHSVGRLLDGRLFHRLLAAWWCCLWLSTFCLFLLDGTRCCICHAPPLSAAQQPGVHACQVETGALSEDPA